MSEQTDRIKEKMKIAKYMFAIGIIGILIMALITNFWGGLVLTLVVSIIYGIASYIHWSDELFAQERREGEW